MPAEFYEINGGIKISLEEINGGKKIPEKKFNTLKNRN